MKKTAPQRWAELDGTRKSMLDRCERYARWTIQKMFPDTSYDQNNAELSNAYQSLGAQCVNHLSNYLMMTLFAPSRPFFRLGPNKDAAKELASAPSEARAALENKLAVAERESSDMIDKLALRAKLYELLKLLLITGNALMVLDKKGMRVLNLRNYVTRRDRDGKLTELLIRERIHKDEIEQNARVHMEALGMCHPDAHGYVEHIRWVTIKNNKYAVDQWYGAYKLGEEYSSSHPMAELPYHAVCWDLSSGNHYGTGLVEDYSGDFAALTALSMSTIQAAILNSEFRWMLRPGSMTSAADMSTSRNGDVLYGEQGDLSPVHSGMESKLDANIALADTYVRRIAQAFMVQSAMTRDAERVTAVELRQNAMELEGGHGGAYSRLAGALQVPLANYCLAESGFDVRGTDWEATVITGLAALSRMGDRDRLIAFTQSLAVLNNVPPQVLDRMKLSTYLEDLASAEGLDRSRYALSEQEYQQEQQARAQAQQEQAAQQHAAQAAINNSME